MNNNLFTKFVQKFNTMAAPKGNKFWELRSKHGKDMIFNSPEIMWEAACEYFDWCEKNPIKISEPIKSGEMAGKCMEVPKARPFTIEGLTLHMGVNTAYFRRFEADLKDRTDERSEGYRTIIANIKQTIYKQKYEGATVGIFNANLISRDLGLQENHNVNHNHNLPMPNLIVVHSGPPLASSEDEVDSEK